MAKSSKTSKSKLEKAKSESVDAEIVDTESIAQDAAPLSDPAEGADTPDVKTNDDIDNIVDASEANGDGAADLDGTDLVDTAPEPETSPDLAPEQPTQEKSPVLPMVLGGVAAGAIGFAIAYLTGNGSDMAAVLDAQSTRISQLEAQITGAEAPDLSPIENQIADAAAQTSNEISMLSDTVTSQLANFDARLSELEKQPLADGTLSDAALAAYQRDLEDLRAEIDAQQANVMSAAAQAEADLAAAREEASQLEQAALASAQAAASRAALNRVASAMDTGAPFASALADLGVGDVPAALSNVADDGVATIVQLADDFPAAATAALATARSEGLSDDAGGFSGFLRSQFDVRSSTPQEGPGPDAVLSRAEAAVKEDRVADALAEIEALPEVVRAELTDWTARAAARADALDAIATLSETLN